MTLRALRAANARARNGKLRAPSALLRTVAKSDATEIYLYGALFPDPIFEGEISAEDFMSTLAGVTTANVTVRINSPGGVVTEGMAIYNALNERRASVTTQVDGLAASVAADILLGGGKRRASGPGAYVMTHKAWGLAIGNDDECRAVADTLTKMDSARIDIYAAALAMSADDVRAKFFGAKDAWHTAADALAAGFIAEIGGEAAEAEAMARAFNLAAYANAPDALTNAPAKDDAEPARAEAARRASQSARMRMAGAL